MCRYALVAAALIVSISVGPCFAVDAKQKKETCNFGADDKSIPTADVHAMEATLRQLGKTVEVHVYDGAGHAFANPSGIRYRPAAAEDAWQRTVAFFKRHLQGA